MFWLVLATCRPVQYVSLLSSLDTMIQLNYCVAFYSVSVSSFLSRRVVYFSWRNVCTRYRAPLLAIVPLARYNMSLVCSPKKFPEPFETNDDERR